MWWSRVLDILLCGSDWLSLVEGDCVLDAWEMWCSRVLDILLCGSDWLSLVEGDCVFLVKTLDVRSGRKNVWGG